MGFINLVSRKFITEFIDFLAKTRNRALCVVSHVY